MENMHGQTLSRKKNKNNSNFQVLRANYNILEFEQKLDGQ